MKQILTIMSFIFFSSYAHSQDFNGLWKVIANVWDGTTERYDNLYFNVRTDSVNFIILDSIVGKGKIKNDTIFILSGFDLYGIDWIQKVNTDSLISSPTNSKHTDNISYKRIDLAGDWEQLNYYWNDRIDRDTCIIVQEKDSIYFYSSAECFATAYLRKDSIIVTKGFKGIGIDYFSMYSNDSFDKVAPLVEAIDRVLFLRLGQTVGIESKKDNSSIQVFPNPTCDYVRIMSDDKRIQKISLYSLSGETLKTQYIANLSVVLNISNLINGIYILEIVFDNNELIKNKIMKIN